ncbi:MAG: hypothetical protein PW735_06095 [Acidobacteriaceae bacterium]|nr:hypothetical protein [Acidobacteriaceae bacterium]
MGRRLFATHFVGDALQQRQGEGGGLAGTRLGGGHEVVAGDDHGDGSGLDRGRLFVAGFGKGAQQRGRKAQRIERHGGGAPA